MQIDRQPLEDAGVISHSGVVVPRVTPVCTLLTVERPKGREA